MSARKKLAVLSSLNGGPAAGAAPAPAAGPVALAPDPEVRAVAKRRQFSAAYKLAVLEEADRCAGTGAIGALLRRERLYSSHLTTWRHEREAGALAALGVRRGRKATTTPERRRIAALEAKNARLQKELEQARLIIGVQKKLCLLLGLPTEGADENSGSES